MTRFMKLFVLGMVISACRSAPDIIEEPAVASTTKAEYEALVKACQEQPSTNSASLFQCIIEAQNKRIAGLEAAPPAPPQQQGLPFGAPMAFNLLPPGYIPVMSQQVFVTTDIPSTGEGIAITRLRGGTYPFQDDSLVACAWGNGGHLEAQGTGRIGVYLDLSGGTKPGVLGIPKFCARADAALAFHNVPRHGKARVIYAIPTTEVAANGYPVYVKACPSCDKTYVRSPKPGWTRYTGRGGY